jgi:hypothetical protein
VISWQSRHVVADEAKPLHLLTVHPLISSDGQEGLFRSMNRMTKKFVRAGSVRSQSNLSTFLNTSSVSILPIVKLYNGAVFRGYDPLRW